MGDSAIHHAQTATDAALPLAGCRVVERSRTVAAAYAGRLLAGMGADVLMLEDSAGSPLRSAPPLLADGETSALFAYLACGKRSRWLPDGSDLAEGLADALALADIFIDDTPLDERAASDTTHAAISARFPALVHVSVLPFGASGPKSHWHGEEINLVHASGEGFLLPNGLSREMFPERPPLMIYGHFANYQGGCAAALSALSAWWAQPVHGGQHVDVSVQDAMLLCGAFALQRLGDGSLEHRAGRSFRYGGVFQTRDGYVELLTLEERQWKGLVELLERPAWALDPALDDALERSRRGDDINRHIRAWMAGHPADDIVARAQELGVPVAKYRTPHDVVTGEHERSRGLFSPLRLADGSEAQVPIAPYRFQRTPLHLEGGVPALASTASAPTGEIQS